jgi:N-acetylglucosaminyldiphosphoundecaprenol N-acetyl-beta-D-mannosaminyltransferase
MKNFDEVRLLNTKFHKITVKELIDYIVEASQIEKKTIVGNVNVRGMNFHMNCHGIKIFSIMPI